MLKVYENTVVCVMFPLFFCKNTFHIPLVTVAVITTPHGVGDVISPQWERLCHSQLKFNNLKPYREKGDFVGFYNFICNHSLLSIEIVVAPLRLLCVSDKRHGV